MSHTYTALRAHVIFSTEHRRRIIPADLQPRLWDYIGGIGRNHAIPIHAVGGLDDHAHVLLSLPTTQTMAQVMQTLKAYSSKWLNEEHLTREHFGWQQGYAAFSVSQSSFETVKAYVLNQPEHHRRHSFEDEFLSLLTAHGIEYDERYVLG